MLYGKLAYAVALNKEIVHISQKKGTINLPFNISRSQIYYYEFSDSGLKKMANDLVLKLKKIITTVVNSKILYSTLRIFKINFTLSL